MNDDVGDILKKMEREAPSILEPGHPVCLRLDGRAFSTFTKGLNRPFDIRMSCLMIDTMKHLVEHSNAVLGYTQSDEITLILLPDKNGNILFGGKRQKLESIYAAICSVYFNLSLVQYIPEKFVVPNQSELPVFDCRAFSVPKPYDTTVIKWRQDDCSRNSVSMLARHYYSHKDISGVSTYGLKQRLMNDGVDWRTYPPTFKYGAFVRVLYKETKFSPTELESLPLKHEAHSNPDLTVSRRHLHCFHENLHLVTNLEGFLYGNEPAKRKYTCAI